MAGEQQVGQQSLSCQGPHGVKENVAAAALELTADDLRQIGEALDSIKVQGDRYPARWAKPDGK
jgi:hypothetical protein